MKKVILIISLSMAIVTECLGQKGPGRYFGDPILTDSLSTLFIPTRYSDEFLASNKIALWGEYYANIIVYDFQTDSYKKLFDKDTFIKSFRDNFSNHIWEYDKIDNLTTNWVFLLVKSKDTNNNGRIDEKDPSMLFAVSRNGENLKQLTEETENVVFFDTYNKQGFILVKLQKDSDHDRSFRSEDKEHYFKKVNLSDLTFGKGIELK